MSKKIVKLILNQQQLEMMDNTVARGIAPDREALVRLALREFAAKHGSDGTVQVTGAGRAPKGTGR
jgi:hypothetical protein